MTTIDDINNKYNIDESSNIPQFVYGIPDELRKKWEEDEMNKAREKYDIDPENNIPREVYGIPDFELNEVGEENDIRPKDEDFVRIPDFETFMNERKQKEAEKKSDFSLEKENTKKSIRVEIANAKHNYLICISYFGDIDKCELMFGDRNDLEDKWITDVITTIPKKFYFAFVERFEKIVKDWELLYDGNNEVKWSIEITDYEKKIISGKGGFPFNWNEFINLISEYEVLFKYKKELDNKNIKIINKPSLSNKNEELVDKYLKEIEDKIDEEMVKLGLLSIIDGKKIPVFGSCHTRWALEKKYLKERYNIDWQTPAEKNPFINYD